MTPRPATRRRGARWAALGAVAVAVTALATLPGDRRTSDASVGAREDGGLVVAGGRDFPASSWVPVELRLDGGSGSALVPTDADGSFTATFRPPAGFTGRVEVLAADEDVVHRTEAEVDSPTAWAEPAADPAIVPVTGAPRVPPTLSPGPVREVPDDIAADCSVDVTEDLNRWLARVPDGSTVRFPPAGCYWVETGVVLRNRDDLVIEGNGSTFLARDPVPEPGVNRAQWRLDYGSRIVLRDMTLIGVNPTARYRPDVEFDHNLFIRGTDTVTVSNVHGRNAAGDFIAIAHGDDDRTIPRDITVSDVSADGVGRMGVSCVACDGLVVERGVFNRVALHAFDVEIEGDDRPARDVRLVGNSVQAHGWASVSVGTPFQTYRNDLSDLYIAGNVVTRPHPGGGECLPEISFRHSKIDAEGVVIEDNVLLSRTDAVLVHRADDVTIRGNSAQLVTPSCGDPAGIRTTSVTGLELGDNRLVGYPVAHTTAE